MNLVGIWLFCNLLMRKGFFNCLHLFLFSLRFNVSMKQSSIEVIEEFMEDLNKCCERIEKECNSEDVPSKTVRYF